MRGGGSIQNPATENGAHRESTAGLMILLAHRMPLFKNEVGDGEAARAAESPEVLHHRFSAGADMELAVNVLHVTSDRIEFDREPVGDFLVEEPLAKQE